MTICLGNLSMEEIVGKLGIQLAEEELEWFRGTRQQKTSEVVGETWHGYEVPLMIECGNYDMAVKVRDILAPYTKEMKTEIQIGLKG